MEEYLRSLKKQLKSFPPEEGAALIEEIESHVESGERDQAMGKDGEQRGRKLLRELGSPEDMGNGFKRLYRPNRFADFLLVAVPYVFSLYLTEFYMQLRPQYPWMDVRINVVLDLGLIAIGLRRRSPLVTLFWINLAITQLLYIVLQGVWQPYWYFGWQTILWAVVLLGMLALFGQTVWKNRGETLLVTYALLPLCMEVLGASVWSIQPVSYVYNPVDRSLLVIFLELQGQSLPIYGPLLTTALFFLASDHNVRWLALVLSALIIGFGREYLLDWQTGAVAMVAQWIYYLYILIPLTVVCFAWWRDRSRGRKVELAI